MATNKHALIRYRTIDRCLRNRHQSWTWKNLAEECSLEIQRATGKEVTISERTIKGDISAMRSNEILGYYAPIEYDRKEKSYYYTDARYRLFESPINASDREELNQALNALRQFAGFRDMMGIQDIITKLELSVGKRTARHKSVIQFDHPPDSPGQEWLYVLYMSVIHERCINLIYHPFERDKVSHQVSPYLLKEYQRRWYLIAYSHNREEMRTFALDRISDIKESFRSFVSIDQFDPQRYFDDIVGITLHKPGKVEDVVFEAYGKQINYFITRPLHKSQVLIWKREDVARFKISVVVNYELLAEIFSYKENIRIISPRHLIDSICTSLEALTKYYYS